MPVNHITFQGRLGTDPREAENSKGKLYIHFSVAHQQNRQTPATWAQVFCYGKTIEAVQGMNLRKGDFVSVLGALFTANPKGKCKISHNAIRAERVWLLVKARTTESKHFKDVEQTRYGEDDSPFA